MKDQNFFKIRVCFRYVPTDITVGDSASKCRIYHFKDKIIADFDSFHLTNFVLLAEILLYILQTHEI